MGSGKKDMHGSVKTLFEGHCNADASMIAEIKLKNVTFTAKENCKLTYMNESSINTTCDMTTIIDEFAKQAVENDVQSAKKLQNTIDRETSISTCTSDDCLHEIKINITKNLHVLCDSQVKAEATIEQIGGEIICDGQSDLMFGNKIDARASCLHTLIDKIAEDDQTLEPEQEHYISDTSWVAAIAVAVGLLFILFILFLFYLYTSTHQIQPHKSTAQTNRNRPNHI